MGKIRIAYDRDKLASLKSDSLYARHFRGILPRSVVNSYEVILSIGAPPRYLSDALASVYFEAVRCINVPFNNFGSFRLETQFVSSSDSSLRSVRTLYQIPLAIRTRVGIDSRLVNYRTLGCNPHMVGHELGTYLGAHGFPIYSLADHMGLDILMSGQIANGVYVGMMHTQQSSVEDRSVTAIGRNHLMWQLPCAVVDRLTNSVDNQLLASSFLFGQQYVMQYLPIGLIDIDKFLRKFGEIKSQRLNNLGGINLTAEELVSAAAIYAYRDLRDQLTSAGAVPCLMRIPFDDSERTCLTYSYRRARARPPSSFTEFVSSSGPVSDFNTALVMGSVFNALASDERVSLRSGADFYYATGRVVVLSKHGMECYLARLREATNRIALSHREEKGGVCFYDDPEPDPDSDWNPSERMGDLFDRITYCMVAMRYLVLVHKYLRLLAHASFLHRIGGSNKFKNGGK